MNEQKNNAPEQAKPEKKLSRTTLTFYIVGLFSVAIALILISYVAQARADRQVENLSSQLNEQQTQHARHRAGKDRCGRRDAESARPRADARNAGSGGAGRH